MGDDGADPTMPSRGPAVQPRLDAHIGQIIAGKYRVVDLVARGGMGRIYRAEQVPIGRIVALKILDQRYASNEQDPQFQKRFLQEAATCGRLKHANTVTIFDYGQLESSDGPTLFIAMEFIEGKTLSEVLVEEGPFTEQRTIRIAREIGRSLKEAHRLGVVHRDLKPKNIMIVHRDDGESVKVLDFGIAKVMEDDSEGLTMADNIVGSPKYMAPEQIRHESMDGRTDLYALGVLMYEMLAGSVPFRGEKAVDVLVQHLTKAPPTLLERSGRNVTPEIEAIVQRCLSKQPQDRYADVSALLAALQEAGDLPDEETNEVSRSGSRPGAGKLARHSSVELPSGTLHQPRPHDQPPRRVLFGIGVVVLALVSLGAVAIALGWGSPSATAEVAPAFAPVPVEAVVAPPLAAVTLRVESTPEGAEVWEGTRLHGLTPLALPLDPAGESRTFEIRRKGYVSLQFAQAPAAEDVVFRAPLQALPAKVASPPKRQPAKPSPVVDDIKGKR